MFKRWFKYFFSWAIGNAILFVSVAINVNHTENFLNAFMFWFGLIIIVVSLIIYIVLGYFDYLDYKDYKEAEQE